MDNLSRIEEKLEYNFLYDKDPVSMDILLSIINEGRCLNHFEPRYTMMKKINSSLRRLLSDRNDREYILRAISRQINDDVNRFELHIIIKGYFQGENDSKWTGTIERLALTQFGPRALKNKPYLYQQARSGKCMKHKSDLFHELKLKSRGFRKLKKLANYYCKTLLKNKIYQINDYMDRQIILDLDQPDRLKVEEKTLTIKDLNFIYHKINRYLINNTARVYKDSYWEGINNAVLERYAK